MRIGIYLLTVLFLGCLTSFCGFSQKEDIDSLLMKQEVLLSQRLQSLANADDDSERFRINKNIIQTIEGIVKNENSFYHPFDSVENAGILIAPDNKLKIYNWNIPLENGQHIFHCYIQYKPDKKKDKIYTYRLKDKSDSIEKPEAAILNYPNWYGALYYNIIPVKTRFDETNYTLLGYDPNDFLTNKKIVEVLRFDEKNKPVFGASIFKNRENISNRLIFEYSEFATMTLQYEEDKEMIVYDHLSPSSAKYEGQYEFYGPDFSYDGLKYEKGIWNTYFDLDLRLNKINLDD